MPANAAPKEACSDAWILCPRTPKAVPSPMPLSPVSYCLMAIGCNAGVK